MHAHWSLGVLIGLPILGLAVLIAVGIIAALILFDDGYGDNYIIAGTVAVFLVLVLGFAAFGYYPYGASWHKWYPVKGQVAHISSRLISDGDNGMSQRFVVEFADGRVRSCDDTRCSLLKRGDTLSLYCKHAWQFAADPGWDCNFVALKQVTR